MKKFISKVKYTKQMENGTFKRVTEPYLVDAVSFTDCEAIMYERLGEIIKGNFSVESIVKEEVEEIIIDENYDVFFKAKVSMLISDEDSNNPKKDTKIFYLTAESTKHAAIIMENVIGTSVVDSVLKSVTETGIVEYYAKEDNDELES